MKYLIQFNLPSLRTMLLSKNILILQMIIKYQILDI